MSTQYLVPGFGAVDESGGTITQLPGGFGLAETAVVSAITLAGANCVQAANADTGAVDVGQTFNAAPSTQLNASSTGLVSVGATIASVPTVNNTGTVLANLGLTVFVYDPVTGGLRVKKTGLTTDALGQWSFTDPSIAKGGPNRCVIVFDADGAMGLDTYNGF